MTQPQITSTSDTIVSEVHIAAPRERVFQALTDPKQLGAWWNNDACAIKNFEMDARPGGKWSMSTRQSKVTVNGVDTFVCHGEVTQIDPPRLLVYTWLANWHDDKSQVTTVRWELTQQAGGTLLKVTHSGLAQLPVARADYAGGWPGVLKQLRNHVENS